MYSEIVELVDAMIQSSDLNGPAECDEAATRLWAILLQIRRRENLTTDVDTSGGVLRWLYRSWNPGKSRDPNCLWTLIKGVANLDDRLRLAYRARHTSIFGVLRLICCCLGILAPRRFSQPLLCPGRLSQACLAALRQQGLHQYLYMGDQVRQPAYLPGSRLRSDLLQSQPPSARLQGLVQGFIEFLTQEALQLSNSCFSESLVLSSSANVEIMNIIVQICVVGYGLLANTYLQYARQQGSLLRSLDRLRDGLKASMLQHEKRKVLINAYHECMGPIIGQFCNIHSGKDPLTDGVIAISQGLDREFWERVRSASFTVNGDHDELDVMELDVQSNSPSNHGILLNAGLNEIHDEIETCSCPDAFRACVTAKLCFASGQGLALGGHDQSEQPNASTMVEYLTSLQRQAFVLSSNVIREFLASDVLLLEDDADTLLQYIQQVVVRPYELERSEVAIGLCIDVLTDLAHLWTTCDNGDVATTGAELYIWFMTKVVDMASPSHYVLSRAAELLHKLVKVCPDYAKTFSLPSARTTLFKVLRDGNLNVKYWIGQNIPDIFSLFILKEHDNILQDIIDSLPSDPTWIEGIALRLIALAYLAASWPTLLRRCVYAIFETAGHVIRSGKYAKHCIDYVTSALKLSESQELFRLFASQLFYTWLETQPLSSIPFSIFGYATLGELLLDAQDEAVGQIVMRGRSEQAAELAANIGISFENLLEASFRKAAAYSIARDVATPPAEGSQAPQAEANLRKLLGKEKCLSLLTAHFPDILSTLYKIIECEEQVRKPLQRSSAYPEAYPIYQEILSTSSSDKNLPPNQQPSFKAKYLIAQIEHLCHRTSYDPKSIWSAGLYVHVFRQIIDVTHPAFGSLHACSALRKIRILICMAGPTALEGYPLEMGLHTLSSYLTDVQCCDDALGLVQYLLHYGASYLGDAPSFLLGNALKILTTMKSFLASTQDSTTQETHFRTTLSKAQAFHTWLVSFLDRYTSRHLSGVSLTSFKLMTTAASKLPSGGSAKKGSHGSDLLIAFLEDQRSCRHLLPQPSRESLLDFLSTSFEKPANFRDDVLGDDAQAAKYASTIWETCQWKSAGFNYLLWSARVLGRAYASQGHIAKNIIRESRLSREHRESSTPSLATCSDSRTKILRLVSDLLTRDNQQEVGLAELALRYTVTELYLTGRAQECENCLNQHLIKAMLWKEYELPSLPGPPLLIPQEDVLHGAVVPDKGHAGVEWIQRLCQALIDKAPEDPLMAPLSHVLAAIEGFAEKAFPLLLHLILLKESGKQENTRRTLSDLCRRAFKLSMTGEANDHAVQILLNSVLYLRTQSLPQESVKSDRAHWLDLDYRHAAYAAHNCSLDKTALLFLEIDESEKAKAEATSKRKSKSRQEPKELPNELLLDIFYQIDEQDAFYGVKQPSSLTSMMSQLEYEHAGFKSLSFRGAYYDGQIRHSSGNIKVDAESMIRVLNSLNLNGLSRPLVSKMTGTASESVNAALNTARKLEQWDVSPPSSYVSNATTVFESFQKINNASEETQLVAALDTGFANSIHLLLAEQARKPLVHSTIGTLAALTEAEEVLSSQNLKQFEDVLANFHIRDSAMRSQRYPSAL